MISRKWLWSVTILPPTLPSMLCISLRLWVSWTLVFDTGRLPRCCPAPSCAQQWHLWTCRSRQCCGPQTGLGAQSLQECYPQCQFVFQTNVYYKDHPDSANNKVPVAEQSNYHPDQVLHSPGSTSLSPAWVLGASPTHLPGSGTTKLA